MVLDVFSRNRSGSTEAVQIHYVVHNSIADLHSLQRTAVFDWQALHRELQYFTILTEIFGRRDNQPIIAMRPVGCHELSATILRGQRANSEKVVDPLKPSRHMLISLRRANVL